MNLKDDSNIKNDISKDDSSTENELLKDKENIDGDKSTVNKDKLNKRIKNTILTLLEISIVAAIIVGILMAIQSTLKGNSPVSFLINDEEETQKSSNKVQKENIGTGNYYIEVNMNKSAVIIYEYSKDDKKIAVKVYPASIGKSVKKGKFKIIDKYGWMNSSHNNWNKFNSYFTARTCIQSVNYREKYSWTMYESSYGALGKKKVDGANIKLSVSAAKWIYNNCGFGTVVNIVKGKNDDKLPLEMEKLEPMQLGCGWDPTDSDKKNPYKRVENGTIAAFTGTVYVEKGNEPNYLFNVMAFDKKGNNITKKLKYDKFDCNVLGDYEVKYRYNNKALKMEAVVKYKVIDTTAPVVTVPERLSLEVDSFAHSVLRSEDTKKRMEDLAKANASSNEGTITAYAFPKDQIYQGDNYVRVVAVDQSGNIGSAQTIINIKVKHKDANERYDPNKHKDDEGGGISMGEKETTKKKPNKPNKPNKNEETTKKPQESESEETTEENTTEEQTEEQTSVEEEVTILKSSL